MRKLVTSSVVVALLAVAACTTSPGPAATPTPTGVNIAELAGLHGAAHIELYELTPDGPGYLLRATITSSGTVDRIIEALDAPAELTGRARCPDQYHAHFVHPGGSRTILGLACGDQPEFIRGGQGFWQTQDAALPEAVKTAVADAISGTPAPEAWVSDEVVQQVVSDLVAENPELEAYAAYDWRRVDRTPGIEGASNMIYVSTEWVVEVEWLVLREIEFDVSVAVPSAGFVWMGHGPLGAVVRKITEPPLLLATPGYTRVYDHELGFGFDYPEDWETQTIEAVDGEDVESIAAFTKPGTPTTLIVTVRFSDLTGLEEVKEEIKEALKELGLTVLEERGIVVNGREGYEVIYKPIAAVKMRQVEFFANGKSYMLVCSTAEVLYDEYRDTFDDIVNSFVIK